MSRLHVFLRRHRWNQPEGIIARPVGYDGIAFYLDTGSELVPLRDGSVILYREDGTRAIQGWYSTRRRAIAVLLLAAALTSACVIPRPRRATPGDELRQLQQQPVSTVMVEGYEMPTCNLGHPPAPIHYSVWPLYACCWWAR